MAWYLTVGSIAVNTVSPPKAEGFYWITIMFSQTLETALGDWSADTAGLGYGGGAILFGAMLLLTFAAYRWTKISRTVLFWIVFVLSRPLGVVVGDFFDKPLDAGGLALSRYGASITLLAFILLSLLLFWQKPAKISH